MINNVRSENQSGGVTAGEINNTGNNVVIKKYINKGRAEGIIATLGIELIVGVIIKLIFN